MRDSMTAACWDRRVTLPCMAGFLSERHNTHQSFCFFLQYYTMYVLVHISVDPGKNLYSILYIHMPVNYVFKYSSWLFIRACKIHALVRKCLSSSYLFCVHFQNWMTRSWEFQASFTSGAKEKKKKSSIYFGSSFLTTKSWILKRDIFIPRK